MLSNKISEVPEILARLFSFADDDEPLLSGSGEVSKDCPQGELDMWRQVCHFVFLLDVFFFFPFLPFFVMLRSV